ncbi:hypothetical protein [Kribbella sp. NPDC051770]|uniref:hypothetical protein n=1 Tax=Kribbella sp. NPDC051770 TaxID=3155413 RepID=UPI00342ED9BC
MNPEELRRRLQQAVEPVSGYGDPLPAVQRRVGSLARRRATATTCALVLAVTSAAWLGTHRAGSEPSPRTPIATSLQGGGGAQASAMVPKTGGKYLVGQTSLTIDLPATPVLTQWRQQAIGQAQPRDAIWLLARCTHTSAQVVVALQSAKNPAVTPRPVRCATKIQFAVPADWSAGSLAELSVGVGSAGEVVVEAGLYRAESCRRTAECSIT